jgi:hypothetical protein
VYRQLSNRHSGSAGFRPSDLVKLVNAYARAGYGDGNAPRMLDAVASYVVQRVRKQHLNAVRWGCWAAGGWWAVKGSMVAGVNRMMQGVFGKILGSKLPPRLQKPACGPSWGFVLPVLSHQEVLPSSPSIIERVTQPHYNAPALLPSHPTRSRPADLSGLVAAFADLRHTSVAVPELIRAVTQQARRVPI